MKKNIKFHAWDFTFVSINLILLGIALLFFSFDCLAQGPWTTKAPMPTVRDPTGSVVNEKIYLFSGGLNNSSIPYVNAVEEYDPATDTWVTKSPIPTARAGASAVTVNGKIFVIGGQGSGSGPRLSIMEVYDPATDTWDITKSSMSTARWWQSASVVNGKIYVIGGERDFHGRVLSVVEEYDPVTDTWVTKNPMPTERWGLSTSVVNGKIYAFGGCHETSSPYPGLSTVEEYDPATDTWTKKKDMPNAMFWVSTSTVDDIIFAIGGFGSQNGPTYRTVEAYDPVTDTWTTHTEMPTARFNISTSVVNGKIYAIGGIPCPGCTPITTNEEYIPHHDLLPLIGKLEVDKSYAKPGTDSVCITVKMSDTTGITLLAEIETPDQTPVDSLQLFDDGNHNDGNTDDSFYANFWQVSSAEEQLHYVDLLVIRIDMDTVIYHVNNMALFTTIGPVVFENFTFRDSEIGAVPGEHHFLYLTLRNDGLTATATYIKAQLTSLDPWVDIIWDTRQFGNIGPGETVQSKYTYNFDIHEDCPDNTEIPMTINISSNNHMFWSDTFLIPVGLTDIQAKGERGMTQFVLYNNYPNPFNSTTTINYQLPQISDIELSIYNIRGQKVIILVSEQQQAGKHEIEWNASGIKPGIYFCELKAGQSRKVMKMVLLSDY